MKASLFREAFAFLSPQGVFEAVTGLRANGGPVYHVCPLFFGPEPLPNLTSNAIRFPANSNPDHL